MQSQLQPLISEFEEEQNSTYLGLAGLMFVLLIPANPDKGQAVTAVRKVDELMGWTKCPLVLSYVLVC